MKNISIIGTIIVISFIGAYVYFEMDEKNNSFATPEEALRNVEDPKYEVIERIDKKISQANDHAYVFFYSQIEEPKDYFAISEFERNKYGWKFKEMNSGVLLSSLKNGSSWFRDDKDNMLYGITTTDVTTVQLGMQVAEPIPLKDRVLQIWILYNPSSEDLKNDLRFTYEKGKIVND